jgi:hypothetical protein
MGIKPTAGALQVLLALLVHAGPLFLYYKVVHRRYLTALQVPVATPALTGLLLSGLTDISVITQHHDDSCLLKLLYTLLGI